MALSEVNGLLNPVNFNFQALGGLVKILTFQISNFKPYLEHANRESLSLSWWRAFYFLFLDNPIPLHQSFLWHRATWCSVMAESLKCLTDFNIKSRDSQLESYFIRLLSINQKSRVRVCKFGHGFHKISLCKWKEDHIGLSNFHGINNNLYEHQPISQATDNLHSSQEIQRDW